MMYTMMIFDRLNLNKGNMEPSKALHDKQGLSLAYTFLIERESKRNRWNIVESDVIDFTVT